MSRQTSNSLSAFFDAQDLAGSNSSSTENSASYSLTSTSSARPSIPDVTTSPGLSAEMLTLVQEAATQAALATVDAHRASGSLATSQARSAMSAIAAVVSSLPPASTSVMCSVPSFVSCFSPLPSASSSNVAPRLASGGAPLLATSIPFADQPFVVGPGFTPVTVKLVQQIVSGKFVDLSDLVAANLADLEREPQVMFDGGLIVNSSRIKEQTKNWIGVVFPQSLARFDAL